MYGIVNFLKPASMTSHDAVSLFRRLTGIKKIGHTGTLDPMAVGVLPICIGSATRLIEYLDGDKSYRAVMRLGMTSETGDIWGSEITETHANKFPSNVEIETCLKNFEGEITQKVPGFSAQKHNGRKLYQYARAGEEIPVKTKQVNIKKINVINCSPDENEILFDVDCSKGTYIRTICTDAGEMLGTVGIMSLLIRTRAGGLHINDSVTIEELNEELASSGTIAKYLLDPGELLDSLNKILLDDIDAKKFVNGLKLNSGLHEDGVCAVYSKDDSGEKLRLLGIGESKDKVLKPRKVINSEKNEDF